MLLTSASLHDSQAAIPLAKMSAERVVNLYDLMDSAYDAKQIEEYSASLGHIPIIDCNPRRGKKFKMDPAEKRRYDERSTAERGFSMLKESFGGSKIRVRGCEKVMLSSRVEPFSGFAREPSSAKVTFSACCPSFSTLFARMAALVV